MTIKIRPMIQADKPSIMAILRDLPEFKPAEIVVAEEVIDSYLLDPHRSDYYILVAEVESTVLGYICYGPTPLTDSTWDVYWQAVELKKQGQGIGRALMDAAEGEIRKAQGSLVLIETSTMPTYEKTRRFHLGQGYEIIGCIPDFYAIGDGKLILQKRLRG